MNVASMTYEELFAAAVREAQRKDIVVWDATPPANRTAVVNGLRLHYLDWGGDSRPPLVLIGHSLGGSVAALVASGAPERVRALGLVDTTLVAPSGPNAMAGLVNGPDTFATLEAFAQHAARFNPRRQPERLVLSLRWNTRQLPDGSWTWKYDRALRQRGARVDDFDRLWTALRELSVPVLFVRAGEQSHLTDEAAERLLALPHVRLVVVPDSAHNVMGDNPHAFRRAVSEFLTAARFSPTETERTGGLPT